MLIGNLVLYIAHYFIPKNNCLRNQKVYLIQQAMVIFKYIYDKSDLSDCHLISQR